LPAKPCRRFSPWRFLPGCRGRALCRSCRSCAANPRDAPPQPQIAPPDFV